MATKLFTTIDGRKFSTQDAYLKHQTEIYDSHIMRFRLEALRSDSPSHIEHCLDMIRELENMKMDIQSMIYNMQ